MDYLWSTSKYTKKIREKWAAMRKWYVGAYKNKLKTSHTRYAQSILKIEGAVTREGQQNYQFSDRYVGHIRRAVSRVANVEIQYLLGYSGHCGNIYRTVGDPGSAANVSVAGHRVFRKLNRNQ